MAHFAQIDENGVVLQVIRVSNEIVPDPAPDNEQVGADFIRGVLNLNGVWKQCSINANFRGVYPGPGFIFDQENDVFVSPFPELEQTQSK